MGAFSASSGEKITFFGMDMKHTRRRAVISNGDRRERMTFRYVKGFWVDMPVLAAFSAVLALSAMAVFL
jgi:hypothetical protein